MNVNFCDEKTVQTYRNGRVLVKRKVNERYEAGKLAVAETQNAKNKVHLVGLMSHSGPNVIYSVSTNLTGLEFDHLIKTKVLNIVRNSTVLMDNASIHTEGVDYLLESGVRSSEKSRLEHYRKCVGSTPKNSELQVTKSERIN